MNEIIENIYKTRTVTGKNGNVHNLHSEIDRNEGKFLYETVCNDPAVLNTLEVGCAYGLSSLHICSALKERPGASHIIVDPFQNTAWDGVGVKNLQKSDIDFFHLIETRSEVALPSLLAEREEQLDLIFIDGCHTFDHALLDCFYATRLLKVGGYLIIDDVTFPSVERVVDFLKNYPCYEEHSSVTFSKAKSLKRVTARIALSVIPKILLKRFLVPRVYRKVFEDQAVRMVALKKVGKDTRNSNWHNDTF
ncbi:MAG: class I SAM-dependent methyltransferase [Cyanobacteria bacterium P01_A01_bin.17]